MPHDTHTTHEPDRVGREGDEATQGLGLSPALADTVHNQTTRLMFGGFAPPERELPPASY